MGPISRRRRIGLLALVDLAIAAMVALVVFRLAGAWSGSDTKPPVCANAAGGEVSCSLTPTVLMLPTFLAVLALLVLLQARRRRSP